MLRTRHLVISIVCLFIAAGASAIVGPKEGGKLPESVVAARDKDGTAFTMKRAWIQRVREIKALRNAHIERQLASGQRMLAEMPQELMVSGTVQVPVFLCEFNNVSAPFDSVTMQDKLFSNNPTGAVTDYYHEVSYNNLTLTGTVYEVVTLSQSDAYYEGFTTNCYGLCSTGKMGQLIQEILDAKDPIVDFGQYDNDGPDGIPNSGDDDGFVDFVSFIHPEFGAECNPTTSNNLWSHSYVYEEWPQSGGYPYETDDAAAGGGLIQISDYTLQPAFNCDGSTIIEIGVFCHEFGHAFGLPDLYDTNGPGNGIGRWGIMGSGNWNQPDSPAHPCAWTRMELGWVTPVDVTWQEGIHTIRTTAEFGDVLRLGFTSDRFRRSLDCRINGLYSMYCGLPDTAGAWRGWGVERLDHGYGDCWSETIERKFTFDGTTPVNFSYNYRYHTEATYDFGYAIIEVDGSESVLAAYTAGPGSGTENHDITPYLSGLTPPATYTLKFRGESDPSWSDEDGDFNSNCGLLIIDDVSVVGGGVNYTTGFETGADGWWQMPDENQIREFWLVENRQPYGFDAHLLGTGLLIMHIDQGVMKSTMGNSGGASNNRVRGVVVEEAHANVTPPNLNGGVINYGDNGDTFPGSTDKRVFSVNSWPNSKGNSGQITEISVTGISDSGPTMTAIVRAGDPAPTALNVTPSLIDNDRVEVDVVITGDGFRSGATFAFTLGGAAGSASFGPADSEDIVGESLYWADPTSIEGKINVYSKTGGVWDLIVTNPDGQQFTLPGAITVNEIVAAQLQSAAIEVVNDGVRLVYVLHDREPGESIQLSRSLIPDSRWTVIAEDLTPAADDGQHYVYVDTDVEPGRTYYYRLGVVTDADGFRELHRGSAVVPVGELSLAQNFPNPFNPTTSIGFYLPKRAKVRLEVYDVAGRLVTRLTEGARQAGPHRVEWNGTDANGTPVASGVYVYRLIAGTRAISKKMILIK